MSKRKICVVSATRAEWYLLRNLCKEIENDEDLELQIIITGAHLSVEFGLTYKEIEKEFKIDKKIEMLLSSDSEIGLCKSMGLAQISFSEALMELKPDIMVLLGDRYESLACASCAMICKIPIAHLHGGEATFGLIDEAIRHSISKMAHFHFVATKEYAKRVIQLGENPKRVFNVGGFGLDNIVNLKLLNKKELENVLNFKFQKKNFLITFHPTTLENQSPKIQMQALLKALENESLKQNTGFIFTKANADTNNRVINEMIDEFVLKHQNAISFVSMGALNYLSTMQFIDAVVGNSSSGLCEAPSFKIATINIGDRQKGRIKASSVIDCESDYKSICKAFESLNKSDFQLNLKNTINPYGQGGAARKAKEILKNENLDHILKKEFYDIDFKADIKEIK
ncbi:UDP-N-acetylglucosamine 2-epimerase [Campylobacter sp. US33a]|uniref:UDP-N-acetylglucosamine 2-epimerase n=1 Tax=Campylobacter sp. US33a TaxID=2498120 RepID=UPI001067FF5F|nr:UDP-N-acetylglucosamine 2-epimerase [Campylobacter sp. US33a]TEY02796.1 UDP-N-acetylglucosamine 2-epimerase (hydrolyzing) [Campylobacter sp. US33a]